MGKKTKKPHTRSYGLFVEGAHDASARGWDALVALWQELSAWHGIPNEKAYVYGFHKGQIEQMRPDSGLKFPGQEPLDVKIARAYTKTPFDVLIVAVDALPLNRSINRGSGCLNELIWMLERFVERKLLPVPFLEDATRLIGHYSIEERPPRDRKHAPRIDALFMNPEFEALVVSDESLVFKAFGLSKRPKGWPAFKNRRPKVVLAEAVELADEEVRRRVRGDVKSNRHAWAYEIVRHEAARAALSQHNIVCRLAQLVQEGK